PTLAYSLWHPWCPLPHPKHRRSVHVANLFPTHAYRHLGSDRSAIQRSRNLLPRGPAIGRLSHGNDLGPRALENGEQFLLLFSSNVQLVQRGFQIADSGVELRVADVQTGVSRLHFFALIICRAA